MCILTDADGGWRIPGAPDAGRIFIADELVIGVAAVPDDPPAAPCPDPAVLQPRRRALKRVRCTHATTIITNVLSLSSL